MDGVDLAHRIRRDHHDLPVLLTWGYSHVPAKYGTHGFDRLRKPTRLTSSRASCARPSTCSAVEGPGRVEPLEPPLWAPY
jgi:hypothetical protein